MSLHQVTISKDNNKMIRNYDLSFMSLTSCGLAVNEQQIVASGDFTGNVFLWKHGKRLPVDRFTTPSSSIRCLLWIDKVLLIGSLSGELFYWKYNSMHSNQFDDSRNNHSKCELNTKTFDCKLLYHFIDGVVTIRSNGKKNRIAVGTTGGYLYVFDVCNVKNESLETFGIEEVWHSQVHKPKHQSNGLILKMEVWSLMWSVDDESIATTSEDQTTIISNASNGK